MEKIIIFLSITVFGLAIYQMYPKIDMTWLSILGMWTGYIINSVLSQRNLKKQKNFEIKQKYYHEFLKIYIEHMSYVHAKKFDFEANKNFTIEVARLAIYASTEVVEMLEKIKKKPANYKPEDLLKVMRKDLGLKDIKGDYSFLVFNLEGQNP